MANLVLNDIVADVRRGMDEMTMSGEIPLINTDMEDLASSNFDDTDLQQRINRASRYVAARVRGRHLKDLMVTILPTALGSYQVFRLLGSRTLVNTVKAQRRSFAGGIKIEATGRASSDAFPSWTYEDHELLIQADTDNPSDSTVTIIRAPADVTEMDDRFREAIIQRTLFSCFATLKMYEMANRAQERVIMALKNYRLPVAKLEG